MSKSPRISHMTSAGAEATTHTILAEIDFTVQRDGDSQSVHIADMLCGTVLELLKKKAEQQARLNPGDYTMKLLVSIVGEESETETPSE